MNLFHRLCNSSKLRLAQRIVATVKLKVNNYISSLSLFFIFYTVFAGLLIVKHPVFCAMLVILSLAILFFVCHFGPEFDEPKLLEIIPDEDDACALVVMNAQQRESDGEYRAIEHKRLNLQLVQQETF